MNETNELPLQPQEPERVTVVDVRFPSASKVYFFDPGELNLKLGDHVITDTARGIEYGLITAGNHRIPAAQVVQPLRRVLRLATEADENIHRENQRKEKVAFDFCLKKIRELGLEMQLVSAETAFDGSKLLFFFTADGRVDFRELVKILASNFHTRIELRQIGVRDKAKMVGGLGICGRPFCCAQFLTDFQPVSIKMAKTQNLSLNPTKISGTCGRLMCCLKYEQEAYEDLLKTSPKAESFVDTPDGRGTVTGVNLMRQSVNVRMEKDPEEVHCYRNCEICVLRSGKAKKTDPPIPEDLAPISGGRETASPIRRYEQRLTAEQSELLAPAEEPEMPEEPAEPRRSRRQNRRERPKAEAAEPRPEKAPRPEKPAKAEPKPEPRVEKPFRAEGKKARPENKKKYPEQKKKQPPKAEKPQRLPEPEPVEAPKPKNRRRYYHRKPKGEG